MTDTPSNVVPLDKKKRSRRRKPPAAPPGASTAPPPPPSEPEPPGAAQGNFERIAGWVGRNVADVHAAGPAFHSVARHGRDEMSMVQLAYARHLVANRLPRMVAFADRVEQNLLKKYENLDDLDPVQLKALLSFSNSMIGNAMVAVQAVIDGPKPSVPPLEDPNPSDAKQQAANLPERSRERMRRLLMFMEKSAEKADEDQRVAAARVVNESGPANS